MSLSISRSKDRFKFNSDEPESFISRLQRAIPLSEWASKAILSKFKIIEGTYKCYLFKVANKYRYIFITEAKINFNALETDYMYCRQESYIVHGALFDLYTRSFVRFPKVNHSRKNVFYDFIIYDASVPHIVHNSDEKNFIVAYIGNYGKSFYNFFEIDSPPSVIVTYVNYKYPSGNKTLIRMLFYEINGIKRALILNELTFEQRIKGISFYNVITSDTIHDEINRAYFRNNIKEYGYTEFTKEVSPYVNPFLLETYTIGGDSLIVTNDKKAEHGDKVIVCLKQHVDYRKCVACKDYYGCSDLDDKLPRAYKGHFTVVFWDDTKESPKIYDTTSNTIIVFKDSYHSETIMKTVWKNMVHSVMC